MATLPADRTKLAQAQSNMAPSFTASSQKLKDALTEAYDTIDTLNQKVDNHGSNATLPHPDKSVTRAKLADKVVGATQLDDAAVGQSHHQDNGIPSRALPDNVILQRHLSDNSVGSAEIISSAIEARHIQNNILTADKFVAGSLQNETQNGLEILAIKADNPIKPESFSGNDYQRLQQAFDQAISQNRPLQISKTYNIGANTITINKGSDVRVPLFVFGGGKIFKDVAGYMFQGNVPAISDLFFDNIWFEGVEGVNVDVFDCGDARLIRINTHKCYFKCIRNAFYSQTYIQDIKLSKDTIVKCSGALVNTQGIYVLLLDGITMEDCSGQVVFQGGAGVDPNHNSITNCKVKDSVIEGFYNTTKPLFELKRASIELDNNYFEVIPNGVVRILEQGSIKASRNSVLGATNGVPFARLGVSTYGVSEFTNNSVPLSPVVDATLISNIAKVIVSNNTSDFANIDPNKKIKDISKDLVNDSIIRLGTNYNGVHISKTVPDTNKVDLCTIDFNATSGGYVVVRGGGIQGNVGVFGVNKAFQISRNNAALTVTLTTDESWGASNLQKDNIFLEVSGTNFVLRANGKNNLAAVQYDLFVEVHGKTNSVTIN